MSQSPDQYHAHKKAVWIVVAVMVTASVSGYFMGLRQTASVVRSTEARESHSTGEWEHASAIASVPEVAEYSRLSKTNYKANSRWTNALVKLVRPEIDLFASVKVSPEQAGMAREERSRRRAFDGAPPVIPHPIDQGSSFSCLACHGEATLVKDRVAPKMSHPLMQNCTQCHVPSGGNLKTGMSSNEEFALNDFVGAVSSGKGKRAYEGGPPSIPHPTFMRVDCASCHGSLGSAALRTSHPWRQSCTQCHAASAEEDQRFFPIAPSTEVSRSAATK